MTRLADRVPVEPLTSERVQRVEDRVAAAFSRARTIEPIARSRRAWLLVPAVAVAAAAAIAFVLLRPNHAVNGVAAPTRVVTPAGEGATLAIGDATIDIAGGSAVEIVHGGDGAVEISLYVGRVDCEVTPRPQRPLFTVIAGEVEVQVVGTVFAVERDDEVRVSVTRGEVRVIAAGSPMAVAAGERWSQPIAGRATLPRWAMAAAEPARVAAADGEPSGTAQPPSDASRVVAAADEPAAAKRAVSSRNDARARGDRDRGADPETARGEIEPNPGDALPRPYAGKPPTARFEQLLALEDTDLDEAVAEYQKSLRGDHAEYALYRLAYVEYSKRGRTRSALRLAEAVEKRFPKGSYASHAHWLRIHALQRADSKSACRAAAQSYLRRYGDGAHREQARRLMDWY